MLVLNAFDGNFSQMSCVVNVFWNKSVVSDPIDLLLSNERHHESHFQDHSELCIAPQATRARLLDTPQWAQWLWSSSVPVSH